MPNFVTIGYRDRAGYERTATQIRASAHARDEELRKRGALMGIAGRHVQINNPDAAGAQTVSGSFMSSPLPATGFAIIEAADIAEAISMVSQVPCAVAHGVVEVRLLEQP